MHARPISLWESAGELVLGIEMLTFEFVGKGVKWQGDSSEYPYGFCWDFTLLVYCGLDCLER